MNLFNGPWNLVFLVGFIVYAAIRHHFEQLTKNNEKTVKRLDTLEKALLAIVFLGNFLLPFLYLVTPVLAFADYLLPSVVPWCGSVVMLLALYLFWRSHHDLGLNWSVSLEVRKEHQLINNGIYRLIRHPMYASIWLWGISQALLLQNGIAGFSSLVTFAPLYFFRVPREEKMMIEVFGEKYQTYMQQTGRILPCLK